MTALIALELRRALRSLAWPVALVGVFTAVGLFVAIWGPTQGLPLWTATLLGQTTAAARVALAVLGTWLAAHVVALDDDPDTWRWSLVVRQPVARIRLARTLTALALAGAAAVTPLPAMWRAVALSGATGTDLIVATIHTVMFGIAVAAIAAAAHVFTRTAVATWATSMTLSLGLALAIRVVSPMSWRLVALAAVTLAGAVISMRARANGDPA